MNHEHVCVCQPGWVGGDVKVERKKNLTGLPDYFLATREIGYIFGYEVEGQLSAIGRTEEEALARLKVEEKKHYESLWI